MKTMAYRLLVGIFALSLSWSATAVPAEGTKIMIAGPSPHAVEIGKAIAEEGGNVVDVAVAVGLTLAVTSPYFGSLGGGGFALIKMDKEVHALDFREIAPKATSPTFYVQREKDSSITGGGAVGVPGFAAGLWEMHKKYGKLPWSRLFKEPLKLAQNGFRVSGEWHRKTIGSETRFNAGGKKYFFKKDGKPYLPGEILKQQSLGKALRLFRSKNVKGFYSGDVARDIVDTVKKTGGVIEMEDLAGYRVRWMKPLETDFKGYHLYLMPPPSSGGVVIKSALNLIEQTKMDQYPAFSVDELHVLGEVLSRSFRGRALLGDPDFHQNPLDLLLSDSYLSKMAKSISSRKSAKLDPLSDEPAKESANTTHYSVLDSEGRSVALTVTLNGSYGSAVVSEKYGVALNNEMDDFTTRPNEPNMYGLIQGKGNYVQPGKRPLSSMSPTLVEKDGKIVLSVGSPGGPRIISGVIQVLYRSLVSGMDIDQAIQAPRIHHQFLPHKLFTDTMKFAPETLSGLKNKKHDVEESWMGRVYGVRLNDKGILEGAHDLRGEGASGGY
ncbi:MAG: gamma-glutamyltransferase [Bdellovibrionaceae bacterium]|nr:gamma-glutamyltransferase [Bdellovibrionales bacterium]MCB9086341.1 gamma-glutamyltransferase [Pseudobdellovibrionaceae bacterium]